MAKPKLTCACVCAGMLDGVPPSMMEPYPLLKVCVCVRVCVCVWRTSLCVLLPCLSARRRDASYRVCVRLYVRVYVCVQGLIDRVNAQPKIAEWNEAHPPTPMRK
jgi:hypothetical protein